MKHCAGLMLIAFVLSASAPQARAQDHKGHQGPARGDRAAPTFAVDQEVAPRLSIELATLEDGRHELRLAVERFKFVAEHTGQPRVRGEGHAHLHVAGVKVGRLFEATHRLMPFDAGVHEIAVDLVTTDHAAYTVAGRPVAARIVLRTGRMPGPRSLQRPVKLLTVDLVGGEVVPGQRRSRTLQVSQGDAVRILWQSDAAAQLHLHGYDIPAAVVPGVPTTMYFDADIAGRFSIASHGAAGRDGHAHRTLLYLEVHPK